MQRVGLSSGCYSAWPVQGMRAGCDGPVAVDRQAGGGWVARLGSVPLSSLSSSAYSSLSQPNPFMAATSQVASSSSGSRLSMRREVIVDDNSSSSSSSSSSRGVGVHGLGWGGRCSLCMQGG